MLQFWLVSFMALKILERRVTEAVKGKGWQGQDSGKVIKNRDRKFLDLEHLAPILPHFSPLPLCSIPDSSFLGEE